MGLPGPFTKDPGSWCEEPDLLGWIRQFALRSAQWQFPKKLDLMVDPIAACRSVIMTL